MSDLLCVPLKVVGDVDLAKPLTSLIKNKSYPPSVSQSLTKLQDIRSSMVAAIRNKDCSQTALTNMQNYYDQLTNLETKIPITQAKIYFKWLNAFDRQDGWLGGLLPATTSYTMSTNLLYEKACVLFNIAALSTQVASSQNQETEEGLKCSTILLQSAAGIFSALTVPLPEGSTDQKPTEDLSVICLEVLSDLCLAQASDCVLTKSMRDNKKDSLVAKLAIHTGNLYNKAREGMDKEGVKEYMGSDWLDRTTRRRDVCGGLAQFHQACVSGGEGKVGEKIARLEVAKIMLVSLPDWSNKADTALKEAKKDNDFIYHERIPDRDQLEAIQPAAVVRPTPLPNKLLTEESNLFGDMQDWGEAGPRRPECVIS